MAKQRILNERLAAVLATLRHGEMLFIGDAGGGTGPASLVPLAPDVERLDLGVIPGVPSIVQLLPAIVAAGDIEAAIVTTDMRAAYPEGRQLVEDLFGPDDVHELPYLPDFYRLRDRVKLFVQTGDYHVHANVVLVGGYPSPHIPLHWMVSDDWRDQLFNDARADAAPQVRTEV